MINIRLLIMLSAVAFAAALAAVALAYGIGRHQGSVSERRACEAEIHAAELTAERQARETERKAQEAQNGLIQNYLAQIDLYKKTIDAYTDADNIRLDSLRDTRKCPAVPAKTKAESGLVCYTPADLRKKIAESVAVGAECDQLAIRYRTLVEVCDVKGNDIKPGD